MCHSLVMVQYNRILYPLAIAGIDYHSTNVTLTFHPTRGGVEQAPVCTTIDILMKANSDRDRIVSFRVQLLSSNTTVDTHQGSSADIYIRDRNGTQHANITVLLSVECSW